MLNLQMAAAMSFFWQPNNHNLSEVDTMINKTLFLLPAVLAAPAMAQEFGEPLKLAEETKISDILAKPQDFDGKTVKVRGTIVDVCPHAGCWIRIAGDKRFQSIQFKVEDGFIVFTNDLKGLEVEAEGVVAIMTPGQGHEHHEGHEGHNHEEGAKAGENEKAPARPVVRINGLGAVAKAK
jgi:hypothetical protein